MGSSLEEVLKNAIKMRKRNRVKQELFTMNWEMSCSTPAENSVNPKTVMERLGHKDIKTTLQTYTFNTEVMQQFAVDVFEKAMSS